MEDDPMDIDFYPPIDLSYIELLPSVIQEQLQQNHIAVVQPELVLCFFGPEVLYNILASRPVTEISLAANGYLGALTWVTEDPVIEDAMLNRGWNPNDIMGFIRNQFGHILCWCFASTELLSACCVLHGWENGYCEFCPWHLYLCCNPTLIGKDSNATEDHVCYAYPFLYGLQHIGGFGVPRVGPERLGSEFDCSKIPPLAPLGEASSISERVKGVRCIESFEEALQELKFHPVACNVVCYPELFTPNEVFVGPRRGRSGIHFHTVTYHAVIWIAVIKYEGKWVGVIKMSNGPGVAFSGYALVCLSTMYIFAGSDLRNRGIMRPHRKPMRLLSDFVVLDMHDKKKDEKKPLHRNDENVPENAKEMKLKEPLSVAGLYVAGSSSSSVPGPVSASNSSSVSVPGPVSASNSSSVSVPGPASASNSISVSVPSPVYASSSISMSVPSPVSASSSISMSVPSPVSTSRSISMSVPSPVSTSSSSSVAGLGSSFNSLDRMNKGKAICVETADPKTESSKITLQEEIGDQKGSEVLPHDKPVDPED